MDQMTSTYPELEAPARAICNKWVNKLGYGFHPDTRGDDYTPSMTQKDIDAYDADMDTLFEMGIGDPYAYAVEALEKWIGDQSWPQV